MPVRVTIEGHRADIRLDRPEVRNALNFESFDALSAAADRIGAAPEVRVVVLSGEGPSFSSGIDLAVFSEAAGSFDDLVVRAQAGFRKLAALPVPVVAAIQGHALGAGLQLALACDLRIVATDASLGILEARFGLLPDLGGTQRLPQLVGPGWAKKMIWLAERIDGRTAERIGLAEIMCAPDDIRTTVDSVAAALVAAPPIVVRETKALIALSGRVDLEEGMDAEAAAQRRAFSSSDFGEAISATFEKRAPRFTGS
jgi:enoyl-CoA hydratase/carnithine racemase